MITFGIKLNNFGSIWLWNDPFGYCPRIRYLTPPLVKMDQQRTALWLVEQLRTALWLVSSLAASYYVVRACQFQAATARTRRARGSCSYKVDCTDRRFNSQLLPIKGLGAFPWNDGGPTLGLGASGKWMTVAILTILGWSLGVVIMHQSSKSQMCANGCHLTNNYKTFLLLAFFSRCPTAIAQGLSK